ncbi:MAG: HlyC/CorC family transporter [Armatimonadetes bacterium]|nr:HlyC/CorC family transporter [Armatimonadota bacterium]
MERISENSEPPQRRSALRRASIIAVAAGALVWFAYGQPSGATDAPSFGMFSSIVLLVAMLLANALFALTEVALISVRHSWIKSLVEKKHRLAPILDDMKREPTRFLSTVQIGTTMVGFFASAVAATTLAGPLHVLLRPAEVQYNVNLSWLAVAIVTLIVSLASIVFGEIVPKSIAVAKPEAVVLWVARPMVVLMTLMSPLLWFVNAITRLSLKPFGVAAQHPAPVISEEELKILVEASEEQGVIEEEEKEMIHSIFEFTDTIAREVMTPRVDMRCVAVSATASEVVKLVRETGHSRIPIFESTIDKIVGIVHVKDLLAVCEGQQDISLIRIMRAPHFVPESKEVSELLEEFRRLRVHMAIVQDEYGGTAGVVTLEDLLEEIVGEIQDEYDAELRSPIVIEEDDSFLVDAHLHLDDVNHQLDSTLSSEEFDTLGGYVFGLFGRQPQPGEEVCDEEWRFVVEETDGARLRRVRMVRRAAVESAAGSGEEELP